MEIGARTRTIPPALRRALQHRDRRLPLPGLPRSGSAEGHHVRHWAQGGPTTLSNLALLCRRHHRAVHEEGYQVERVPDGALQFRRPDGRILPDVASTAVLPADPVGAFGRSTPRRGSSSMRAPDSPDGWGSAWTLDGRSTCCIRSRREPPPNTRPSRAGRRAASPRSSSWCRRGPGSAPRRRGGARSAARGRARDRRRWPRSCRAAGTDGRRPRRAASGMPGPWSRTVSSTAAPTRRTRTSTGGAPWRRAFSSRLRIRRRSSRGSPRTRTGSPSSAACS